MVKGTTFVWLLIIVLITFLDGAKARSLDTDFVQTPLQDATETQDGPCQDCIHVLELLKHLMRDENFQMMLKNTLDDLCDSLPDELSKSCHETVEKQLIVVLNIFSSKMNPGAMCTYLGLCVDDFAPQMKMLMNNIQKTFSLPPVSVENSIQCGICRYVLNTANWLIPRAKVQSAIITVVREACGLLPFLVKGQCLQLTGKYIKMVFEVLLNPASPKSVCSQMCRSPKTKPKVSILSDCESCLTLVVLSRLQLGLNASESHVSSFLRFACQSEHDVLPECESFTQRHGKQLQGILGKEMGALDACERAALCLKRERVEQGGVGDPCTLGPSYSCRDLTTASSCGVVSFCQKVVWN